MRNDPKRQREAVKCLCIALWLSCAAVVATSAFNHVSEPGQTSVAQTVRAMADDGSRLLWTAIILGLIGTPVIYGAKAAGSAVLRGILRWYDSRAEATRAAEEERARAEQDEEERRRRAVGATYGEDC